jgi:hypothetical protein
MRWPWLHAPLAACALVAFGGLAFTGASCDTCTRVGYEGPLPSAAARQSLGALNGKTLPAGSIAFCANELRVDSFLVLPNMPALLVDDTTSVGRPPAGRYWIPVLCDGDVADLHQRIAGSVPSGVAGAPSDAYRKFMTGK